MDTSGNDRLTSGLPTTPFARRREVIAVALLAASVLYAAIAAALLPHRLAVGDAAEVFLAGAAPGLLVTLLLCLSRPETIDRPLRHALIGISLSGAASVAILPLVLAGH